MHAKQEIKAVRVAAVGRVMDKLLAFAPPEKRKLVLGDQDKYRDLFAKVTRIEQSIAERTSLINGGPRDAYLGAIFAFTMETQQIMRKNEMKNQAKLAKVAKSLVETACACKRCKKMH